MADVKRPRVSLIVVAYNAATYMPSLCANILAQDYPADQTELVLVDSLSEDDTKAQMRAFAQNAPMPVKVLDNPGRTLPCGCNVALAACQGELVVRVDAHAGIPPDFLRKNVAAIDAGHDIVGGYVAATPPTSDTEAVLVALDTSRFAGGAAAFRNVGGPRPVDTLAYAMYKKSVYDEVGRYDERLARTEDNDMHARMRAAGYQFYYVPGICSTHTARRTLSGLIKQKWDNGRWIGLSLGIAPRAFSLRHIVPTLFVLALIGCVLAACCGLAWPLAALAIAYAACALGFAVADARRSPRAKLRVGLCLPVLYLVVHLAYGVGTLIGLCGASRLARQPSGR